MTETTSNDNIYNSDGIITDPFRFVRIKNKLQFKNGLVLFVNKDPCEQTTVSISACVNFCVPKCGDLPSYDLVLNKVKVCKPSSSDKCPEPVKIKTLKRERNLTLSFINVLNIRSIPKLCISFLMDPKGSTLDKEFDPVIEEIDGTKFWKLICYSGCAKRDINLAYRFTGTFDFSTVPSLFIIKIDKEGRKSIIPSSVNLSRGSTTPPPHHFFLFTRNFRFTICSGDCLALSSNKIEDLLPIDIPIIRFNGQTLHSSSISIW